MLFRSLLGAAKSEWHFKQGDDNAGLISSALWLLERSGKLDDTTLIRALGERLSGVRFQAARIATDRGLRAVANAGANRGDGVTAAIRTALVAALGDSDAFVQRAAADALAANPKFGAVWSNRGAVLLDLGRAEEALASIERSLAVQPGDVTALYMRGNAVRALGRAREALAMYDRVLALAPDHVAAHVNRGDLLRGLGRLDEALVSYGHAAAREPGHTEILHRCGAVLREIGRYEEALACFDRILEIAPGDIDAYESRGIVFRDLARFEDAIANYDRALKVAPDRAFLFGERLFCRMNVCDWRGIANDFAGLEALIEAGNPASAPFPVLAMPLSTASQKANAETYARAMYSHKEPAPQFARGGGHERIRLGYFSSDFHNHAIPFLIADLFERHDRSKFEIIAFSISPPVNDAMHARLEKAFDRFVEAGEIGRAHV